MLILLVEKHNYDKYKKKMKRLQYCPMPALYIKRERRRERERERVREMAGIIHINLS